MLCAPAQHLAPSPMKTKLLLCAFAMLALVSLSGCVTRGYKLADEKKTPPAVLLNLSSADPQNSDATSAPLAEPSAAPTQVVVSTVIVYQGPGSWKREAYWDEYVVSLKNNSDAPLVFTEALLHSNGGETIAPGDNPWKLERVSKTWWQTNAMRETGTYLALGVGTAASLGAAFAASFGTMFGGTVSTATATAGAIGSVTFFALPVVAGGTVYMNLHRKHQVEAEFTRRRLVLPVTLVPGQTAEGSLFFRITPSPRELVFRTERAEAKAEVKVNLAPLSGLHVKAKPGADTPATAGTAERNANL